MAVSESAAAWAVQYRKIKSSETNEFIPYTFRGSGFPFLEEIHEEASRGGGVVKKGAQVGITEMAMNVVFWAIDQQKRDCMYWLPLDDLASDFSATRFNTSLEQSPHIASMFDNVDNVRLKRAGTASLYIRGLGGTKGKQGKQKSVPASVVVFDEFDEMDPGRVAAAETRTEGQAEGNVIILKVSTPSLPEYGVDLAFRTTSMGTWMMKCPHCGRWQNFTLRSLRWDMKDPETGTFVCTKKGCIISEQERLTMILGGEWVHAFPQKDRGWWLPSLYSPVQHAHRICKAWAKALVSKFEEQEFYNGKCGLAHLVAGAKLDATTVRRNIGNHQLVNSIQNTGPITMGVDQGRHLHCRVSRWDKGVPSVIGIVTVAEFEDLDKLMASFRVRVCVIDGEPESRMAKKFRDRHPGKVFLGDEQDCPKHQFHLDESTGTIIINRTEAMDIALDRHRTNGEAIHLPTDLPEDYVTHHCAPARVYEKDKRSGLELPRYREGSVPDHYCHASVFDEAAHWQYLKMGGGYLEADVQQALAAAVRHDRPTANQNF